VYLHGINGNNVTDLASNTSFAARDDFYLAAVDDLVGREQRVTTQAIGKICCKTVAKCLLIFKKN